MANKFTQIVEQHPVLTSVILGGTGLALTIYFANRASQNNSAAPNQLGLGQTASGFTLAPTNTDSTTLSALQNISQQIQGLAASITGNTGGPNPSPTPSPTSGGGIQPTVIKNPPPILPPVPTPIHGGGAIPVAANPPSTPSTISYVVEPGDTLTKIGAHFNVPWQNIFNLNRGLITDMANARGNPVPGGPQNNIFANIETLQIPIG